MQATEFYDLARKFRVTGVPKTVVNDEIEILGSSARTGRSCGPRLEWKRRDTNAA